MTDFDLADLIQMHFSPLCCVPYNLIYFNRFINKISYDKIAITSINLAEASNLLSHVDKVADAVQVP